jgi:hypothetical protein
MTNVIFSYNISDTDALFFKSVNNGFDLISKHEGSEEVKIATYDSGKWIWEGNKQRSLFFQLMKIYPKEFQRAIKSYKKSLETESFFRMFTCAKRRFLIQIHKITK